MLIITNLGTNAAFIGGIKLNSGETLRFDSCSVKIDSEEKIGLQKSIGNLLIENRRLKKKINRILKNQMETK